MAARHDHQQTHRLEKPLEPQLSPYPLMLLERARIAPDLSERITAEDRETASDQGLWGPIWCRHADDDHRNPPIRASSWSAVS